MRHKYESLAIVLTRSPLGEANTLVTLLTPGLGLVRARAQGLRKPGAKLAAALATFAESELVLVRGKEGWRVAGAVLAENRFQQLPSRDVRVRAARVCGLLLRLVAGETHDAELYDVVQGFFDALSTTPADLHEAAELLVVLRVLAILGLDAGEIPGAVTDYTQNSSRCSRQTARTISSALITALPPQGSKTRYTGEQCPLLKTILVRLSTRERASTRSASRLLRYGDRSRSLVIECCHMRGKIPPRRFPPCAQRRKRISMWRQGSLRSRLAFSYSRLVLRLTFFISAAIQSRPIRYRSLRKGLRRLRVATLCRS